MSGRYGLGERRIIEIITDLQRKMPSNPLPFGDDVSATRIGGGRLAVLKCDMLVGMTDIPEGMSLWQASRKAVVASISDLASKGVNPTAIMTSLGLPRNLSENNIRQIASGLNSGATEYGAYLIGGDTNESSDFIIDVFAFGVCMEKDLIRRRNAEIGDIVAVTGDFGLTALGLKITQKNLDAPRKLRNEATRALFMPTARLMEGLALARSHLITSSIDSSDGLAWSLYELSRSSKVGFTIDTVPIHQDVKEFALKRGLDYSEFAFYGGEEYELVVTMNPELYNKAKRKVPTLKPIGRATRNQRLILRSGNQVRRIEPRGYEHLIGS